MNKVYFIGNLTRDPDRTETNTGIAVCRFTIAVNRGYKTDDGNSVTDFFNITAWRGLADTCGKYLQKGAPKESKPKAEEPVQTSIPGTAARPALEPVDDDQLPF